ncbi:MAG: hypothetical protein Q4P15_11375 [Propionibacteriaceae bacterium]|nr:hypothetical protein [Propionibacteriaceae bacterium]
MSELATNPPHTPTPMSRAQIFDVSVLEDSHSRLREPVGNDVLADLRLDHVLASLSDNGRDELVVELFTCPPEDLDTVEYRQEVAADLRDPSVRSAVATFRRGMDGIDERVLSATKASSSDDYHWQQRRRLVEAMAAYTTLVRDLRSWLGDVGLHSRGMSKVREYLEGYATSPAFMDLAQSTAAVIDSLDRVQFHILMTTGQILVTPAVEEGSYTDQMVTLFERFQDGQENAATGKRVSDPGISHVTAQIVAQVARMEPEPFQALENHCRRFADFQDATLVRFVLESGFYLSYLALIAPIEDAGLVFSRPRIVLHGKHLQALESFDLALAGQLVTQGEHVVTNDACLDGPERVLVITGPNQGGKTTYARMIGQLHHFASIGLPVPGHDVELPLVDTVLTHFEREEGRGDPTGKLEEELVRLRGLLEIATPRSLLVLNEAFTSTSLQDARELGERVLEKIIAADMLAVYVTFVDELSRLGPATVSLVGQTAEKEPDRRTFKVSRQLADGDARALAIAGRNGLTYAQLLERIPS